MEGRKTDPYYREVSRLIWYLAGSVPRMGFIALVAAMGMVDKDNGGTFVSTFSAVFGGARRYFALVC